MASVASGGSTSVKSPRNKIGPRQQDRPGGLALPIQSRDGSESHPVPPLLMSQGLKAKPAGVGVWCDITDPIYRSVLREELHGALQDIFGVEVARFPPGNGRAGPASGPNSAASAYLPAAARPNLQVSDATDEVGYRRVQPPASQVPECKGDLGSPRDVFTAGAVLTQESARINPESDAPPTNISSKSSATKRTKSFAHDWSENVLSCATKLDHVAKWAHVETLLPASAADMAIHIINLEEPERTGPIARFVASGRFETVCSIMIIVNSVVQIYTTNYEMEHALQNTDAPGGGVLEGIFICFYTAELCIKLYVHRLYFFINDNAGWNNLDFWLILLSLYDQFMQWFAGGGGEATNVAFLRMLRTMKMAKILRVFRLFRFMTELRLILNSIMGSLVSLFWSVVMIGLIMYMWALLFVQRVTSFFQDQGAGIGVDTEKNLRDHFGTVQLTMLTLWKGTSGGDPWHTYDYLIPTGHETCVLFMLFVAFTQIALINILTGLFVENAMKLAEPDRQALYSERERARHQKIRELQSIIKEMDHSGTGQITDADFTLEMENPYGKLRTYLGALGILDSDAIRFYHTLRLANMDHDVDIKAFVEGCMKLEGTAQSLDLQAVMVELNYMHRKVEDVHKALEQSH